MQNHHLVSLISANGNKLENIQILFKTHWLSTSSCPSYFELQTPFQLLKRETRVDCEGPLIAACSFDLYFYFYLSIQSCEMFWRRPPKQHSDVTCHHAVMIESPNVTEEKASNSSMNMTDQHWESSFTIPQHTTYFMLPTWKPEKTHPPRAFRLASYKQRQLSFHLSPQFWL